jgi:hypothetical protein
MYKLRVFIDIYDCRRLENVERLLEAVGSILYYIGLNSLFLSQRSQKSPKLAFKYLYGVELKNTNIYHHIQTNFFVF